MDSDDIGNDETVRMGVVRLRRRLRRKAALDAEKKISQILLA